MKTYSENFSELVSELESAYESALETFVDNRHHRDHTREMLRTLRELTYSDRRDNFRKIWWFASAMVESLRDGGLVLTQSHVQLCRRILVEVKKIARGRASGRSDQHVLELVAELGNEVMASSSDGELTREVKHYLASHDDC